MKKTFISDEDGAITVDWVVLTAAIVALGLAVITTVSSGVGDISNDISSDLASRELGVSGAGATGGSGGSGGSTMCSGSWCLTDADGDGEYETGTYTYDNGQTETHDFTGAGYTKEVLSNDYGFTETT